MSIGKILIAEDSTWLARVQTALAGYQLMTAMTMREAMSLLDEDGIDLIVVGIHFDESRAIEFLKRVRESEVHAKTALIVMRFAPSEHEHILRQTMGVVRLLSGVTDYIEDETDGEPIEKRLRAAVDAAMPAEKRVS